MDINRICRTFGKARYMYYSGRVHNLAEDSYIEIHRDAFKPIYPKIYPISHYRYRSSDRSIQRSRADYIRGNDHIELCRCKYYHSIEVNRDYMNYMAKSNNALYSAKLFYLSKNKPFSSDDINSSKFNKKFGMRNGYKFYEYIKNRG